VFYGWWRAEFLVMIAFSTALDYTCALKIEDAQSDKVRRRWMLLSVLTNLSILFLFKYFYFFVGTAPFMQGLMNEHQSLKTAVEFLGQSLPVGISFYTFQTMSYTLDVYYKRARAERKLGQLALFVSFFPQLVAGPIERYSHLNEQLKQRQFLNYANIQQGLRLMLYGFFVKMVIADNLSYTVTSVFSEPGKWVYYWNIIGVLSFGFQIYADFFGYSLIAQGAAKCFGIDLMDNFKRPYLSKNISEFWQRWHISLSTWFRDYVYIPLGGNRVSNRKLVFNVLVVFLLSGLWHGANYTFIVWGGLHGLYYLIERYFPLTIRISLIKGLMTFLAVAFAWIFFRAASMQEAYAVIQGCMNSLHGTKALDTQPFIFLLLFLFGVFEWQKGDLRFDGYCAQLPAVKRWSLYCFMLFCILVVCGSEYNAFIYFKF
jgi:D-alanyl-lipoteichoic acid acyltransferase DltB (MBOAT superfamily)